MKKLTVHIRAELDIPDDWEFVEHPSGIQVLKIGDSYVDFDIAPLCTTSNSPDATWSDTDIELVEEVLECVSGLDSELEVQYQQ
ncbi:MAG TPA: hypothetical protein VL550_04790 [Rhodocyclaceae bacterium]|jgi:hypothetical protein|nr:hypothetical protein [Rhodocyclaceae bacterium]